MENDFKYSLSVGTTSTAVDGVYTDLSFEGDEVTYTVRIPGQTGVSFSRSIPLTPEDIQMLMDATDYLALNRERFQKNDMMIMGGNKTISGSADGVQFSFLNNIDAMNRIDDTIKFILATKEVDIRKEVHKEVEEYRMAQRGIEPEVPGGKTL